MPTSKSCKKRAGTSRIGVFLAASLVIAGCTAPPGPQGVGAIDIAGYSYTSFNDSGFRKGKERGALAKLRGQTGSRWAALCVFEFQSTPESSDIGSNTTGRNPLTGAPWQTTSTLDDVRLGVEDAHANGLAVMLKPHVDCYSGGWRAAITPDRDGRWFRSYADMMLKYAALAAETRVEMLCIGVEYARATRPQYDPDWKKLIADIRQVYPGKLTYAANWTGAFAEKEAEMEYITFWPLLDYMGVDFYGSLTGNGIAPLPDYAHAYARMIDRAARVGRVAERVGRKVLLTEVGIQSAKGALTAPYDYTSGNAVGAEPDDAAQELYYRAVLDAFGSKRWCSGFFWWNWESVEASTKATNYTAEDKPAAALLKRYYTVSEEG